MKAFLAASAALLLTVTNSATAYAQPDPGGFSFTAVEVADIAKSEAFYVSTIGLKRLMVISKPTDPFVKIVYGFAGGPSATQPVLILIHYANPTPEQNRPSGVKLGFRVDDAHAAGAKAQAAGYKVIRLAPEQPVAAVNTSVVCDPDGVVVELVQMCQP